MVIQIGDRTVTAQRLVGVENRRVKERVPIHRHHMMERTAVDWDPTVPPGNATIRNVQVKQTNSERESPQGDNRRLRLTHPTKKERNKIPLKLTHHETVIVMKLNI